MSLAHRNMVIVILLSFLQQLFVGIHFNCAFAFVHLSDIRNYRFFFLPAMLLFICDAYTIPGCTRSPTDLLLLLLSIFSLWWDSFLTLLVCCTGSFCLLFWYKVVRFFLLLHIWTQLAQSRSLPSFWHCVCGRVCGCVCTVPCMCFFLVSFTLQPMGVVRLISDSRVGRRFFEKCHILIIFFWHAFCTVAVEHTLVCTCFFFVSQNSTFCDGSTAESGVTFFFFVRFWWCSPTGGGYMRFHLWVVLHTYTTQRVLFRVTLLLAVL